MRRVKRESARAGDTSRTWVGVMELARQLEVEPTTIRRWIWRDRDRAAAEYGGVVARQNERGDWELDPLTIPPKHKARYLALHPSVIRPQLVVADREGSTPAAPSRWSTARGKVRERATDRLEVLLKFENALAAHPRLSLQEVAAICIPNLRRAHKSIRISLRSIQRWRAAYAEGGLDALVDGNTGNCHRGSKIPREQQQFFTDHFLRANERSIAAIYDDVIVAAHKRGWESVPSYEAFRRFARRLPRMVKALGRKSTTKPRKVLPHVRRDPTSVAAYEVIQGDPRQFDIPVRCDTGCAICTGPKATPHFPTWTAFADVRSRRVLASELTIGAATGAGVLRCVRRMIEQYGLCRVINVDNGPENIKAFGKPLRKIHLGTADEPTEAQIVSRFAALGIRVSFSIPGNPQGKAIIERLHGTFRRRFDQSFEGYRGELGKRSDCANELYCNPQQLPTLSEVRELLELAIREYNELRPHRGRGMDGRTPDEVFRAHRIPIERPHPQAFSLVFFEPVKGGRIVGPVGVRVNHRYYRLQSLAAQLLYFGERVEVRIDPDDDRAAIIVDETTGEYVCDARVPEQDATYSTRDEITRAIIGQTFSDCSELVKMARAHIEGAKERLEDFARERVAYYRDLFAQRDADAAERNGDEAMPAPIVLIGGYSAAAAQRVRTAAHPEPQHFHDLIPALAQAVAPVEATTAALCEDDQFVLDQIRKRASGLCEIDGCEIAIAALGLCLAHHREILGADPEHI